LVFEDDDGEEIEKDVLSLLDNKDDEFIKKLKPNERAALLMFVFDGLSQNEIAHSMRLKEGHVKVLIHRARSFLNQELGGPKA